LVDLMDWEGWARRAEQAIDVANRGDWAGLFAPGARFGDPHTPDTDDLRGVSRMTKTMFPDWTQEITSIRGGDGWAVFEWIGRATYHATSSDDPGHGAPIEMHGATIVEVDDEGLVTSWRDYLDRKEPENQIKAAVRAARDR
jgi:hypothetical protein